jgi:hypothetical protein
VIFWYIYFYSSIFFCDTRRWIKSKSTIRSIPTHHRQNPTEIIYSRCLTLNVIVIHVSKAILMLAFSEIHEVDAPVEVMSFLPHSYFVSETILQIWIRV